MNLLVGEVHLGKVTAIFQQLLSHWKNIIHLDYEEIWIHPLWKNPVNLVIGVFGLLGHLNLLHKG